MKNFTAATILATLSFLSASNAATVTLQTTQCIQPVQLQTFDVTLNELSRGVNSTCGLKIVSASGIDVSAITCQAFKDAAGTTPGSAVFTFSSPALIATNPVEEGSILCKGSAATTSGAMTSLMARGTGTAVTMTTIVPTGRNATTTVKSATLTGSSISAPTSTFTGAADRVSGLKFAAGLAGMVALVL